MFIEKKKGWGARREVVHAEGPSPRAITLAIKRTTLPASAVTVVVKRPRRPAAEGPRSQPVEMPVREDLKAGFGFSCGLIPASEASPEWF